jgi:hypothetical protein
VQAAIFRRVHVADPREENTWSGKMFFDDRKLSPYRSALIGVAGAIGEHVGSRDADLWEDEYLYEPFIMSASDWQMTFCEPGEPDAALFRAARRVHGLLNGKLRGDLFATARRLINGGPRH